MLTETSMLTVLYSHNLMQNSANLVHMYCIHLYKLKYGIYTKNTIMKICAPSTAEFVISQGIQKIVAVTLFIHAF